jgi:hypothetical protein
MRFLEVVALC